MNTVSKGPDMSHVVQGVTRETFPDVVRAHNLKPGQRFTIIIDEEAQQQTPADVVQAKGNLARLLARAGGGARIHGGRSKADIDAEVRENRGDE